MATPSNRTLPQCLAHAVERATQHIAAALTETDVLYREAFGLGMVDGVDIATHPSQRAYQRARELVRECATATKHAMRARAVSLSSGHAG